MGLTLIEAAKYEHRLEHLAVLRPSQLLPPVQKPSLSEWGWRPARPKFELIAKDRIVDDRQLAVSA